MKPNQFIRDYGLDKAREIVKGMPNNSESYQGGYYFREIPEFQFYNGIHEAWNLIDNDGEYFKKCEFETVKINDLKTVLENLRILERFGETNKAKQISTIKRWNELLERFLQIPRNNIQRRG